MESTTVENGLLDAANRYIELGYRVFPCKPDGKIPAIPKKAGGKGVLDATDDPDQVESWWTRWSSANIGLSCEGLLVVDIDPDGKGWPHDPEKVLDLVGSPSQTTPRGGTHHIFRKPAGESWRCSAGKLAKGVDVRTDGGYIVASPSAVNGKPYAWLPGSELSDPPESLPVPPQWLQDALDGIGRAKTTSSTEPGSNGEGILPGQRNATLTSMAGSMRRKGFDAAAILAALKETNRTRCNPPLPDEEVERIASNVGRYPPATRRYLATDDGNALRLIDAYRDGLLYCESWGKWLVWDGRRWETSKGVVVMQLAQQVIRDLHHQAIDMPDENERKLWSRHSLASQTAARIQGMVTLARSEVLVKPDEFNNAPWLLNVANGTIDLQTGELRPHRREDHLTTICPTEYHPDADCPTWLRFLDEITAGDRELQSFLRLAVGMSLAGIVEDHVLMFCYGRGSNGKSTFLGAIQDMLGDDYAIKAAHDLLISKRNDAHPTELADLAGKRFVATVESGEGRRLAESLVKELTGGDRIRARRMREDYWQFQPSHTIWLASNHKPIIRGTDLAIWRRIRLVPFTVQIPEDRQDKNLPEKLRAEAAGILNWAVLGCIEWKDRGLGQTEAVQQATDEYRSEMDILGAFLDDCCEVREGYEVAAMDLYGAYKHWADSAGERPGTQKAFGMALGERGFAKDRFTGGTYKGRVKWNGLRLLGGE